METKNTAPTKITVEEFIKNVLITEIGEIKNDHPYLAFSLICEGIEFLGKMKSSDLWGKIFVSKKHFINALKQYNSLNKYYEKNDSLYKVIRCGLCHGLRLSPQNSKCKYYLCQDKKFSYTTKDGNKIIYLGINQLYNDFKEACECLLNDKKSLTKHKEFNNGFLTLAQVHNLDNEIVTVSGITFTVNNQNPDE